VIQEKKLFSLKSTKWTLISILIIVPLGLYSKFYSGEAEHWVNDSFGGVLYVIFWCLFVFLFLGNTKPWKIAIGVFAITCSLEFLQLLLSCRRRNRVGVDEISAKTL
jgi:glycopeptide antibiotics resistance protein